MTLRLLPHPRLRLAASLLAAGAGALLLTACQRQASVEVIAADGVLCDLTRRLAAADLRRDPAALLDALKAQGFFPGPRVAFVEEATDGLAPLLQEAMADWRPGDALLVVTAGALAVKSALRKLFEPHPGAHALALYDDPPGRDEIEAMLARAGVSGLSREAMADVTTLAQVLDPGDFRQTLEKIALYKRGDATPLSPAEIALCAPATIEAEVDEIINAAASGRVADVGALMRRLDGQGVGAVKVCMDATRHFRTLHGAACDAAGPASGLARARPPVFGPRRDMMLRQAQALGLRKITFALETLGR